MSKWHQRFIAAGLMGLFVTLLICQGKRDTPFSRRIDQQYIQPFIDAQLSGIVIKVRNKSLDLENIVSGRKAKEFISQDLSTYKLSRYEVGWDEPVQVGDTIRKNSGQNWFLLSRQNGRLYHSHPIRRR